MCFWVCLCVISYSSFLWLVTNFRHENCLVVSHYIKYMAVSLVSEFTPGVSKLTEAPGMFADDLLDLHGGPQETSGLDLDNSC